MKKLSLQSDWKHGPDMPVAMDGFIQSVAINGTIYVGGGDTDDRYDQNVIMAYDTETSQWDSLTPYKTSRFNSVWNFAMASINNKLVVIGGRAHHEAINDLLQWQLNQYRWTSTFPPMPTARWSPSAISYKRWLVVAGGYGDNRLDCVEILDTEGMQWSTGPSTPTPWEKNEISSD